MLTLEISQKTWLHTVKAWIKMLFLAVSTYVLFSAKDLTLQLVACSIVATLYLSLGKSVCLIGLRLLKPIFLFSLILLLYHYFFSDIKTGGVLSVRFITLIALANLITMTTPFKEMLRLFNKMLLPFGVLGINTKKVALSMAMVIRFTPVLIDNATNLRLAWNARNPKRPSWRIIAPLFIVTMDDAVYISDALRARGGID